MCGIAGIVNLNYEPIRKNEIERMVKVVKYRGPDDEGYFIKDNVGLGHCRLSILDLSLAGHQPMSNRAGNIWIVYNGEIYNYLELRKELEQDGYSFQSKTDTEVIIYAYEKWGEKCLEKFNGMWAFAIWDTKAQKLFCARDRFGVKPFYYYFDNNIFTFGSEIKQLLVLNNIKTAPNDPIVHDYLIWGLENHTDETFFKNIKQLPGGHALFLDLSHENHSLAVKRWYSFFDLSQEPSELSSKGADHIKYFYDLLEDSIKLRLRSDVPIGSCLSGGLDSSSIVCLANKILRAHGNYHQEVFTSCFDEKDIDERQYAEEIIKKTGCIKNFVFPDQKTLNTDLEDLIWHQEEPFGGLSIFAQWCVMRVAKQRGIKVLLDGQGGDELLLGYERYYIYFLNELLKKFKIYNFLHELFLIPKNSKLNHKQLIQYSAYFSLPWVRSRRLFWQSNKILNKDFSQSQEKSKLKQFIKPGDLFDLQKNEILRSQLPHLLHYEDRNSMAFSIETRLPFLDYRLVEFLCKLSPNYKIKDGWTKHILRQSMAGLVPDPIRWRKNKIGFDVPENKWLRVLTPKMKEVFEGNIYSEKYINKKSFLNQLGKNKIPSRLLWRTYNLELWARKFNISKQ